MSTIYMSQLSAALPLMERDHHHHHHRHHQDHHQGHFQAFTLPKDPPILFPFVISSSSSSSPSDTTLSYGSDHHLRQQQQQAVLDPQHMIGGSTGIFATPFPTVESIRDDMIDRSPFDPYDTDKLQASCESAKVVAGGKWSAAPAAKMKITRKTSDPSGGGGGAPAVKKPRRRAQVYEDHGHGAGGAMGGQGLGVIRVCSDCNTTKTPLWRSGPCGPKSLCNACGIRQRKARRAMMASGSPASTVAGTKAATPSDASAAQLKVKKEKRADVDRSLPFKKRCKVVQVQDQTPPATNAAAIEETAESFTTTTTTVAAATPTRGPLIDNIGLSWSKSATATATTCSFRPSPAVAPAFAAAVQDEITDAAMLLMTLSCGLVRS